MIQSLFSGYIGQLIESFMSICKNERKQENLAKFRQKTWILWIKIWLCHIPVVKKVRNKLLTVQNFIKHSMESSWTHRLDYAETGKKTLRLLCIFFLYDLKLNRSIWEDWTISGLTLFLRYSPFKSPTENLES